MISKGIMVYRRDVACYVSTKINKVKIYRCGQSAGKTPMVYVGESSQAIRWN